MRETTAKYKDVCPDAVERIYARAERNHKNAKEADKAARSELHQLTGAFMTVEQLKRARGHLSRFLEGDESALFEALKLHASTRERLEGIEELYETIFGGERPVIADLACGLNPLFLGMKGFPVRGLDVHGGLTNLVNDWAQACGWDVSCRCADLLSAPDIPVCDCALMMKLLPVLERQEKGAGAQLMACVPAKRLIVTFPLRTLGGRKVGMESQYARWMEENLPAGREITNMFTLSDELIYCIEGAGV